MVQVMCLVHLVLVSVRFVLDRFLVIFWQNFAVNTPSTAVDGVFCFLLVYMSERLVKMSVWCW